MGKIKSVFGRKVKIVPRDKLLPRLSLFFFGRPRTTALIWLAVAIFGIVSYTTLLRREGFPNVAIPIVMVNGSYAVGDAAAVDASLAKPVSEVALKQAGAKSVIASSDANFFNATVQYSEDVDSAQARQALEKAVRQSGQLPKGAQLQFTAPYFGVTGGSLEKLDAAVSVYSRNPTLSLEQLTRKAQAAVAYLNKQDLSQVDRFFVQNQFEQVTHPLTGRAVTVQRSFDRYGERDGGEATFFNSVIVGVASIKDADTIKLDHQIQQALDSLHQQPEFEGIGTTISASYAPSIEAEISELQRVLLEGLLAVLVVGSIVIALRASAITVISMLTVIAATLGLLYLIGYTLNVITLFALILGLALIVDDTIIMVEAIDSSRRKHRSAAKAVEEATRKISRAMVAATFTAVLSFAPLLFVSGILGSFIRAVPITIISALLISLLVALVFIPLFARFILLGKKQMGADNVREIAAGAERRIAEFIARPIIWARRSLRRQLSIGITAVVVGILFIGSSFFIFKYVTFNIFPATKDSNQLAVALNFAPGTSIGEAQSAATAADRITSSTLGPNLVKASYYGAANSQLATLYVDLTPYGERDVTAPQLADKLNVAFADFSQAKVNAYQIDVGPPGSGFTVNINAEDRPQAIKLADDMAAYLKGRQLVRASGERATITDATVADTGIYQRTNAQPVVKVTSNFDDKDTTTLTTLAEDAVKQEFTAQRLAEYGLQSSDVTFDIGQESENQDSFRTLALAFPVLLLAIYLLLAVQFRSLLQPLLIFMAIPFSLFGVALGLYLTDNAISFFSMLGFFALIGLSIKNAILLTDYANQARRAGMGPTDAAAAALGERFRPLVATSLTAVVSLTPLALTSPFWQGLAVTLIFGLLSSTLLVILVFPYYYLGAEYLRLHVSRRTFFLWLLETAAVTAALAVLTKNIYISLLGFVVFGTASIVERLRRRPA